MKTQDLLFEIGVEEIPSGYFAQAKASILAKAPKLLEECGFQYDSFDVYTTPRRIVLYAKNFKSRGAQEEERLGPSKEQAYQDGKPTSALLGFLRSANGRESQIYFKETPRGERVCLKVKRERKSLRDFFETLPKQIEFPKLMRWARTRYTFTRPIRWTFAFVGTKKQNYKISDVSSSDFTYGHRFLSKGKIKVRTADFLIFQKLLKKNHVILDPKERERMIRDFLKRTRSHDREAVIADDEELVQTTANLVEEPFPVVGSFDKKYLKLPAEVLATCMKKGQKIFACYGASGKLTNQFLAVINGRRASLKLIAQNYENVLCSRLEDAQFFFHEDTKTKLEVKVAKLKDTVFLGSLGSYWDKSRRIENQAEFLGEKAGCSEEIIRHAKRGAYLAKADLMTHLVYEFPELQGIAGSEYACLEGEGERVASAILGQYFPRSLSEHFSELKKNLSLEGALVGLADRMDLLVGALGIGVEPDSSQDPYALRRSAGSIVKILRAHTIRLSLSEWIKFAADLYGNQISKSKEELGRKLIPFFKERITFELGVKPGTKEYELLQGILRASADDIANVYLRFEQLKAELSHEVFGQACKVMERTYNITKGSKEKIPDSAEPALFQDERERRLFELITQKTPKIEELIQKERYAEATRLYGEAFYKPLHDFFDGVMVNVEDPKVRVNRQALMKKINRLHAENVADLSQLAGATNS